MADNLKSIVIYFRDKLERVENLETAAVLPGNKTTFFHLGEGEIAGYTPGGAVFLDKHVMFFDEENNALHLKVKSITQEGNIVWIEFDDEGEVCFKKETIRKIEEKASC